MTPNTSLPDNVISPAGPLRQIDDLPGPAGVPLLGNLLQVKLNRIHRDIEQWCGQYGKLFRVAFGPFKVVVVADPALIAVILRDRPARFRRPSRSAEVALEMSGNLGLFMAEAEDWRNQRRMVMQALAPAAVKAYFPSLQKVATRLQRRWEGTARNGIAIDLAADLKRYTVDIIAGLAFGTDVNTIESGEDVIQRHLDVILPAVARRSMSLFAHWRYVRLPADRRLERSVGALKQAVDGFIAQARGKLAADPSRRTHPRNLLEAMIVAADDPGSGITDKEVSGNVMTMLLAGEDTTANTLAWAIWLLASHPKSLARARAEVDAELGPPHEWTPERFAGLSWLEACANETMRLKPVAPLLVVQALRDTTVADIRVPAGTLVFGAMRSDSLREEYFAQAAQFDPGRWLDAGHSANSASRIGMPFGAGPRVCPGRHLAMLEMKMALATLLGRFDIESVGTEHGGVPEERMSFTMEPGGLAMRLRPRAGAAVA